MPDGSRGVNPLRKSEINRGEPCIFSRPFNRQLKTLIIFLLSLALWVPARAAETGAADDFGYAAFQRLSRDDASAKAKEIAARDFREGRFRILVYGLRRHQTPSEKYLKEHYGVTTTPIAGCIVSDGILGAAEGYNSTIKPLLNQKFGRDIFGEAKTAANK